MGKKIQKQETLHGDYVQNILKITQEKGEEKQSPLLRNQVLQGHRNEKQD